jgi:L-amino acid N-acyltransferase YncA
LQEAIGRGPKLGMHSLVGLIFGHNQPSIALFQVAGFERWGLLHGIACIDKIPRDLTIFGRHI